MTYRLEKSRMHLFLSTIHVQMLKKQSTSEFNCHFLVSFACDKNFLSITRFCLQIMNLLLTECDIFNLFFCNSLGIISPKGIFNYWEFNSIVKKQKTHKYAKPRGRDRERERERVYIRSASRIMNWTRKQQLPPAIDDQRPAIVSHATTTNAASHRRHYAQPPEPPPHGQFLILTKSLKTGN